MIRDHVDDRLAELVGEFDRDVRDEIHTIEIADRDTVCKDFQKPGTSL